MAGLPSQFKPKKLKGAKRDLSYKEIPRRSKFHWRVGGK
jgi:hypothetical protein